MIGLYDELVALAEREHALVVEGAWEELAAVDARRREVLASLPAVAPVAARGVLERAAAVQGATTVLLATAVDGLRRELTTLSHGRVAVRGYRADAVGPAGPGARVDLSA